MDFSDHIVVCFSLFIIRVQLICMLRKILAYLCSTALHNVQVNFRVHIQGQQNQWVHIIEVYWFIIKFGYSYAPKMFFLPLVARVSISAICV